jgi:hypothetical protein
MVSDSKRTGPMVGLRAFATVGMAALALGVYSYVGARPALAGVAGCTGQQLAKCAAFCSDYPYFCCLINRVCWCEESDTCNVA